MQVDECNSGLGTLLMQDGHLIPFASKALNEAQRKYATIEKELLAICFGCNRFHNYIFGKNIIVETDHKPLLNIMAKSILKLSPHMQRMRMRQQSYDISLTHIKGTMVFIADTLSRAHSPNVGRAKLFDETLSIAALEARPASLTSCIIQESNTNKGFIILKKPIETGWAKSQEQIAPEIHQYFPYRVELTTCGGHVLFRNCIMVPSKLRNEVIDTLHETNLGITKVKQLARDALIWPNINRQLEECVLRCEMCQWHRKVLHTEPQINHDIACKLYHKIGVDLSIIYCP